MQRNVTQNVQKLQVTVPFHTAVARWAAAFQRGKVVSADMRRTGCSRTVSTDVAHAVIAQCLEDGSDGLYRSYKHIQTFIEQL